MKTFTKYIWLLGLIIILATACGPQISEIKNPEKETTVEIQNLQKDTAYIAMHEGYLLVFDKEEQLKYKVDITIQDCSKVIGDEYI